LFLSDGTATAGADAARFQRVVLEVLDGLFARVYTIDDVLQEIRRGSLDTGP
jgi:hypothetical protein